LENVQARLQIAQGNGVQQIRDKFDTVSNKNDELKILKQISKILIEESTDMDGLPKNLTASDLIFYEFAPITLVDVKRPF